MRSPETHRQKKYRSQILGYLFLLVLVIIFIATVGVKLLINASLFIVQLTQKNKNNPAVSRPADDLVLPPEIFDLPAATNSATIKISGRGASGKNLFIYVNDELQNEMTLEEDAFEADLQLQKDINYIYLIVDNPQNKQKKQSKTYSIVYKDEKPALEISSPRDREKTSKDEIQIVGATDLEVFVKINNLPVITDAEGKFSHAVRLQSGENKITIAATDSAGNAETKELTIIYEKDE